MKDSGPGGQRVEEVVPLTNSFAIVNELVRLNIDTCFVVSGGYTLPLLECLRLSTIEVIAVHHEQAAAMAAQTYGSLSGRPCLVLVTNGPGVTNALTGVAAAFIDSTPMLCVSGEVMEKARLDSRHPNLRQSGVQQVPTETLASPICKAFIKASSQLDPCQQIRDAYHLATHGRRGPVWIEIPLDVQTEPMRSRPSPDRRNAKAQPEPSPTLRLEKFAQDSPSGGFKRPLVLVGRGAVGHTHTNEIFDLINRTGWPLSSSWGAKPWVHRAANFVGSPGVSGDRSANLALATCDVLVAIGCRLSFTHVGYDLEALKDLPFIMIDIDRVEFEKLDASRGFFTQLDLSNSGSPESIGRILDHVRDLSDDATAEIFLRNVQGFQSSFPLLEEPHLRGEGYVNSFDLLDRLNSHVQHLADSEISKITLVLDAGTAYRGTMPSIRPQPFLQVHFAGGLASMGSGLPGIIGSHYADKKSFLIGLFGDGGTAMNLQEMASIRHHLHQALLIVLNDGGYMAIANSQRAAKVAEHVSSTSNGVPPIDFGSVAESFGFNVLKASSLDEFDLAFHKARQTPFNLIDVRVSHEQSLMPRPGRRSSGRRGFADLSPHLEECDFEAWWDRIVGNQP